MTLKGAVAALNGALHRNGPSHGVSCAAVGDHDRVADRFDLGAAGGRDRLTKIGEVAAAQIVSGGVADLGRELGRADQIGEKDGDETARQRLCP
jgi:hypothetical protein